jgi:hypothetical protein
MLGWRVCLPVLKRFVPLPSLVRLMWSDAPLPVDVQAETIVRLAAILYPPREDGARGNCYERSLVVYRYLSRARGNPTFVVGVDRAEGEVGGHVWVLLDGRPVHDTPEHLAGHVELVSFGPQGRRLDRQTVSAISVADA